VVDLPFHARRHNLPEFGNAEKGHPRCDLAAVGFELFSDALRFARDWPTNSATGRVLSKGLVLDSIGATEPEHFPGEEADESTGQRGEKPEQDPLRRTLVRREEDQWCQHSGEKK
jgi:hypothetical protein